jgi:hypothetical protein
MSALCSSCKQPVLWSVTQATGKRMPLDPLPVDPETPGALIHVGGQAWSRKAAITDYVEKHGISEDQAATEITAQYPHHLSHFATCPNAKKHRRPR